MQVSSLKDISSKIGSGATPRGGKNSYISDGISLIRSLNVYDFEFDRQDLAFITEAQAEELANVEVQANDILLNITGASVARCTMVPSNVLPARVNQHVAIVRIRSEIAEPKFVFYTINSPQYKKKLLSISRGGATREALTKEIIENFEIQLPELKIQRRIASILSAYDDLIENNTRRIKILEDMARLIYREWFVEFRAPGVRLRKATPEEKKVTGKDMFPEEWEVKKLGELATEKRENVDPKSIDPDTPYLGLEHIPRRSLALQSWGKASDVGSTKLVFNVDDILFGKIRPYFHKVCPAPIRGVCSSDTIVVTNKSKDSWAIVLLCMSSDNFVSHASQTSQGTKMPRANWDVLAKYPIVYPSNQVLASFGNSITNIVKQIYNLTFQNINLRRTRDMLLPKLISGEVEV